MINWNWTSENERVNGVKRVFAPDCNQLVYGQVSGNENKLFHSYHLYPGNVIDQRQKNDDRPQQKLLAVRPFDHIQVASGSDYEQWGGGLAQIYVAHPGSFYPFSTPLHGLAQQFSRDDAKVNGKIVSPSGLQEYCRHWLPKRSIQKTKDRE